MAHRSSGDSPRIVGLRVSTRAQWRRWLAGHHGTRAEAWLRIARKGSARAGVAYHDALEEALCFGWIDGKMHSQDASSYLLRFSPRRPKGLWSRLNRRTAERLIEAGLMTDSGLRAIDNARRSGTWDAAYSSRRRPRVPADLRDALRELPEAWEKFRAMPNSHQTRYVVWIAQAVKLETRQRRIADTLRRLSAG